MPTSSAIITDVAILLAAALLLGTLAECLRQSAILGYLLAGMLVGPSVLQWVGSGEEVAVFADLGVAMLLFTIGLEFSVTRLRRLGTVALVGGSLQIVFTLMITAAITSLFGLRPRASLAVGAIVAISSTACVLRLLVDRAAMDSLYGRNALGILLLQDAAVIPLIFLLSALSGEESLGASGLRLLRTAAMAAGLIALFYVLCNYVVPRLLNIRQWAKNRELPILLAMVVALGAVVAALEVDISPAMGAFIAGVLLGGSPFAVQIRADVSSVRTLLVTVFFASIGLLGDPQWMLEHGMLVAGTVVAIVVGKVLIVTFIMMGLRSTRGLAVATALCLAQVGEFSFVLAVIARGTLLDDVHFHLIISATIVTLFLTPFLVTAAPHVANWIEARRHRGSVPGSFSAATASELPAAPGHESSARGEADEAEDQKARIFVIGFGPAGQGVAQALLVQHRSQILVMELNPRNVAVAQGMGLAVQIGDGAHREVLEHAQIHRASVIIITVPDPKSSRTMIHHCKYLAPNAVIIARARYHVLRWELQLAGAMEVVDEEEHVGLRLAAEARKHLRAESET